MNVDEEKKEYEELKSLLYTGTISQYGKRKLIEIIEKQSKEIEEYKKQLDLDYVDKHFVPIERYNQLEKEIEELKDKCKELIFEKQELTSALLDSTPNDKIKAKIEELEKLNDEATGTGYGFAIYYLQSLLEKE